MNLLAALASVRIFPRKVSHQTLTTRWGKALDPQHILEEYPRPQMIRDQYINLNGEWNYTVLSEKNTITKEGTLLVPFSPEAPLSGAGFQLKPHEKMLCERLLSVKCLPSDGSRCILHFGAVDQYAKVLVNGKVVVSHIGGYLPFSADITDALQEGCNTLTVHIEDRSDTSYHSVGKQKLKRGGMFYTAQSGIWQTVWMEWVPAVYVKKLELTPLYEKETVHVSLLLNHPISGCSDAEAVVCHVRDMDGRLISKGISPISLTLFAVTPATVTSTICIPGILMILIFIQLRYKQAKIKSPAILQCVPLPSNRIKKDFPASA